MSEQELCSECGKTTYPDNPKHTVRGDCIRGFNSKTDEKMILCWECFPSKWEMDRDDSGLNKFKKVDG